MCLTVENQTFGEKLKTAREQRNLTRVELAEQIGSSSKTIARWERGETQPRPQFHQKLCVTLNTTPQELGLETKTAEIIQWPGSINRSSASIPSSDTPFSVEPKKYPVIGIIIGMDWSQHFPSATDLQSNLRLIEIDDQPPFITAPRFRDSLPLLLSGSTGSGKSTLINALLNIDKLEEREEIVSLIRGKGFEKSSPIKMVPPTDVVDEVLHVFIVGKVFLSAQASSNIHIKHLGENLVALYQYALISNFYEIMLPGLFTVPPQLDIGGIVTDMTNAALIIHQVLSDPSWQGIGVFVSILLSLVMGYKKKSSLVYPLFPSFSLAA